MVADVQFSIALKDRAAAAQAAVERIAAKDTRELDYELVDRFAGAESLATVRTAFQAMGAWACRPQAALLRYSLRVAPEYGAAQVKASLAAAAGKNTGCDGFILQNLGPLLAKVQPAAIDALDNPKLAWIAATELGRWGTAEAKKALWDHLEHPAAKETDSAEQGLVTAIATGTNWLCGPDKLARLAILATTPAARAQIDTWTPQWSNGPATLNPIYPEDGPNFMLLQYSTLTEDQLRVKLAQFPTRSELHWQFYPAGRIFPPVSMELQQAVYERIRAAAAEHGVRIE